MCSSKIFPLYQYRVMEIITELIMAILLFLYMSVELSSNAQFTIKSQTFCGTQAECQRKRKKIIQIFCVVHYPTGTKCDACMQIKTDL